MTDVQQEAHAKIRRSLGQEFVRMEDDYDQSRNARTEIVDKLMAEARKIVLTDEKGDVDDNTDTKLRVITTALKALTDSEKAASTAIMLKLKQQEQVIASSAATRDRYAIILAATAPGKIEESFPSEDLDKTLEDMFGSDIQETETKVSPRDLTE